MSSRRILVIGAVLLGLVIGFLITDFLKFAAAMGYRIPSGNMAYDYSTAIFWALALGASIMLWPIPSGDKRALLWLWLIRTLVTLGFMLFYENHYGLDAYLYYSESREAIYPWAMVDIGKGSANIGAIAWLIARYLPTASSYHTLKVIFSMIGFIATYIFYRAAVKFLERDERRFLYVLGLFPSILFWSSILGKEPVNFLGMALYFYGVVAWYKKPRVRYFVPIALGTMLAMSIRVWYGIIFFAPLAATGVRRIKSGLLKMVFTVVSVGAFVLIFQVFNERFKLENSSDVISSTNQFSRSWNKGGSGQEVPEFKSLGAMLSFAPIGMFTALFRPLPGEVMNLFGLLAGLENFGVIILLIMALRQGGVRSFTEPIVFWAVALVLCWSFFYGFVSFQNLGSAVRFKLQILPILLAMLLYLVVEKKRRLPDVWDNGIPRQLS